MSAIATHDATVLSSTDSIVTVQMHVVSACASCKAHEKCAFVDKDEKIVEVQTSEWQQYHPGDSVVVSVNESRGLLAVLLAYIIPALVIIATIVLLQLTTASETLTATTAILATAFYFLILYAFRDKLQSRFSFGISKQD